MADSLTPTELAEIRKRIDLVCNEGICPCDVYAFGDLVRITIPSLLATIDHYILELRTVADDKFEADLGNDRLERTIASLRAQLRNAQATLSRRDARLFARRIDQAINLAQGKQG